MITLFSVPSKRQAYAELLLAGAIWGFGFPAAKWALESFPPMWANALRFILACAIAAPFIFFMPSLRKSASHAQLRLAMLPGIFLGITMCLQTIGLLYTSVTKAGFITVLYVVFVPLLEWILLGKKVPRSHWFLVALAMTGAIFMCRPESYDWNRGDLLVLGCALTAALHILQLEVISPQIESSFNINVFQAAWGALLPLLFAVPMEPFTYGPITPTAIAGLVSLSAGSTLIAFTIQVRAQRALKSPSTVSMFFLLESPFAALFAFALFNEQMSATQWFGAALILAAAVGTLLQDKLISQLQRSLP